MLSTDAVLDGLPMAQTKVPLQAGTGWKERRDSPRVSEKSDWSIVCTTTRIILWQPPRDRSVLRCFFKEKYASYIITLLIIVIWSYLCNYTMPKCAKASTIKSYPMIVPSQIPFKPCAHPILRQVIEFRTTDQYKNTKSAIANSVQNQAILIKWLWYLTSDYPFAAFFNPRYYRSAIYFHIPSVDRFSGRCECWPQRWQHNVLSPSIGADG